MDHHSKNSNVQERIRGTRTGSLIPHAPPKAAESSSQSPPRRSDGASKLGDNPLRFGFWDRIKPRRKLCVLDGTMRASQREKSQSAMDVLRKLTMERARLLPLVASSILLLLLLASFSRHSHVISVVTPLDDLESNLAQLDVVSEDVTSAELPPPPRLAYLISGTRGDGKRMRRALQALYHPRNYYLLHLDLEAPPRERLDLARYVRGEEVFRQNGNVFVVGKANLVTYRGPTMVAATLHGAAILLRKAKDWDWFINLSAADYPLVTQDDLLHVFSYLPRDLNFIEHTSDIGWKEFQRAKPIIIDPGLYQNKKTDIFWATQRRAVPTAFRLFTGSAWFALTRSFMEYCNVGWENLPRTLLMYYTNFVSSPEGYFHTVLCNSQEFRNTTVNHDLHYIKWDTPPKQHPNSLTLADMANMTSSGAAFARKFDVGDPVLDEIDERLLSRKRDGFTPGGWCIGRRSGGDPCALRGNYSLLRPGPGARRFEDLVVRLLSPTAFRTQQCVSL